MVDPLVTPAVRAAIEFANADKHGAAYTLRLHYVSGTVEAVTVSGTVASDDLRFNMVGEFTDPVFPNFALVEKVTVIFP